MGNSILCAGFLPLPMFSSGCPKFARVTVPPYGVRLASGLTRVAAGPCTFIGRAAHILSVYPSYPPKILSIESIWLRSTFIPMSWSASIDVQSLCCVRAACE